MRAASALALILLTAILAVLVVIAVEVRSIELDDGPTVIREAPAPERQRQTTIGGVPIGP